MRNNALILALLILCLAVACKPTRNSSHDPSSVQNDAGRVLKYNLATLVGDYEKHGHKNRAWDGPAKEALTLFAEMRSSKTGFADAKRDQLTSAVQSTVEAKCDDPLVQYLQARYAMPFDDVTPQAQAQAFLEAAVALQQSRYAPIRKFYASLRAAEALKLNGDPTNTPPEVHTYRRQALANLVNVLQDRNTPISEVEEGCRDLFTAINQNPKQQNEFYEAIEKPLFKGWSDAAVAHVIKARYYIEYAWQARGTDWANRVTEEGWKLMAERLVVAEQALNRAWELDPHNALVAKEMINLELGQGKGRDRMELWFDRAMTLDPGNYAACRSKLYYLEPKWYGSAKEMLAFGRQCVEASEWTGQVPLVLVDAHVALAAYVDQKDRSRYWRQPAVWADVKSSYDRFLERNPEARSCRSNYAWHAYQCGQWEAFNQQVKLMGPVNYGFFGGKAAFMQMVKTAQTKGN
jgi:hypothetical protein